MGSLRDVADLPGGYRVRIETGGTWWTSLTCPKVVAVETTHESSCISLQFGSQYRNDPLGGAAKQGRRKWGAPQPRGSVVGDSIGEWAGPGVVGGAGGRLGGVGDSITGSGGVGDSTGEPGGLDRVRRG